MSFISKTTKTEEIRQEDLRSGVVHPSIFELNRFLFELVNRVGKTQVNRGFKQNTKTSNKPRFTVDQFATANITVHHPSSFTKMSLTADQKVNMSLGN